MSRQTGNLSRPLYDSQAMRGRGGGGFHSTQNKCVKLREVAIGGFPKISGRILGVPIIRIIVFWGLYWGPLI